MDVIAFFPQLGKILKWMLCDEITATRAVLSKTPDMLAKRNGR